MTFDFREVVHSAEVSSTGHGKKSLLWPSWTHIPGLANFWRFFFALQRKGFCGLFGFIFVGFFFGKSKGFGFEVFEVS